MKAPQATQDELERELFKKSPALAVASRILHEASVGPPPSLADAFVAQTYREAALLHGRTKKVVDEAMTRYRHDMKAAHRFTLDNSFVEMATVLATAPAEKTLARVQYATLPYETTWIEFNLHVKVRMIQKLHQREQFNISEVPSRTGCLLQRINDVESVCTMISDIGDNRPTPHMTSYFFSLTPTAFQGRNKMYYGCRPVSQMAGKAGDSGSAAMWGYTTDPHNMGDQFTPKFLRGHGDVGYSRMFHAYENYDDKDNMKRLVELASAELYEFTGHMRWLVTVLAMLNEIPVHSEPVHREGHMRVGTFKKHKYMDYHRVTLRLPKTNPVKYYERLLTHTERRHRAHEVRAHWRTYLHEKHCRIDDHTWEYDHEHGYRLCGNCMAYSRLIHEHIRGDVDLGWVRKDYVIKKERL